MGNKINETFLDRSNISYEYNFDGNGNDTAGGANATLTNITFASSEIGYNEEMADLNGTNAYATASHSYSGNFTICGWLKWDSFNTNNESQIYRITGAGSTNIGFSHNNIGGLNRFQLFTNDGTNGSSLVLSSLVPQTGKWYLVCASGDGTNRTLKFRDEDGVDYVASTTVAPSVTMSGTANFFRHPTVGRYLNGQCAGLRIYNNYAISDDEFNALYLEGLRKLGPTNLLNRSQGFPKYSLPNLESSKVLEISKAQSGGTYYDQTGNGNNGTPTNVTDSAVGLNNVMSFNGNNSGIDDTFNIGSVNNFSIGLTFKATDISLLARLFARGTFGNDLSLQIFQSKVRVILGQDGSGLFIGTQTPVLESNKYYRLLMTYNGSNLKLYVNGVLCVNDSTSATIASGSVLSSIGYDTNENKEYFNGNISNFINYNRELNEKEAQQDYYSNKIV